MSISSNVFQIGKTYSFDVYPAPVIGNRFTNVRVVAIFDSATAALTTDVDALHAQVRSYVSGIPDSASKYLWVKFITEDNVSHVIGLPWINVDTIRLVSSSTIQVTISGVSTQDINIIKAQLVSAGYDRIKVDVLPSEVSITPTLT